MPSEQIALWADRLRDISANGLRFSENIYDQERYQAVQEIALQMMALATESSPIELEQLWAPIFARPTPLTVGDAAVIDESGRILLIQRADNQMWAMPGGADKNSLPERVKRVSVRIASNPKAEIVSEPAPAAMIEESTPLVKKPGLWTRFTSFCGRQFDRALAARERYQSETAA